MAEQWLPTMGSAPYAFLSAIAISSAHDELMRRSSRVRQGSATETLIELRVRHMLTSMISGILNDPQIRTSDATLIAVLHLLNAGVMGRSELNIRMHVRGISAMVHARGGLANLGLYGHLALGITAYVFVAAYPKSG